MVKHTRDRTKRPHAQDLADSLPSTSNQAASQADQTSSDADETSASADVVATDRDRAASDRETVSAARDSAAADRDRAAEELEQTRGPGGPEYEAAAKHAASVRALAVTDREMAAADRNQASIDRAEASLDRERAANDREHAAMDRRQAISELERAHLDDLTGAHRRETGEAVLQQELDRASRLGSGLVLAFVDVNGLKATNDTDGHAAGDARLRDVVNAMRSKIRSYEPIVRYGGDEFVCSFAGVDIHGARTRFDEIETSLDARGEGCSISVGLATYRAEDTLESLVERADAALMKGRTEVGQRTPASTQS